MLIKEAKSNENIAHLISNSQANITCPGSHLQNAGPSSITAGKER